MTGIYENALVASHVYVLDDAVRAHRSKHLRADCSSLRRGRRPAVRMEREAVPQLRPCLLCCPVAWQDDWKEWMYENNAAWRQWRADAERVATP